MAKFRGFNNTTVSVPKRGLNRREVKQVQRQIEKNKRIKNSYVTINGQLTVAGPSFVVELTSVGINGPDAIVRQTSQILLKSYNIKIGFVPLSGPSFNVVPFRVIIARSKQGPAADITSNTGSITDFLGQPDPDLWQVYTDEIHTVSGSPTVAAVPNISPGYLIHMYKSFKKKQIPHMIVGYNDTTATPDAAVANKNPILMKFITDPNGTTNASNFGIKGFSHMKFFDKE